MSSEHQRTIAVIAARGGSKGIPDKNLVELCGKPLLVWTIEQARAAKGVDVVAVSSDSKAILAVAEKQRSDRRRTPGRDFGRHSIVRVRLAPCARCARRESRAVRAGRGATGDLADP